MQAIRGTIRGCLRGRNGRLWINVLKQNPQAVTPLGFIVGGNELNIPYDKNSSNDLTEEEIEKAEAEFLPKNKDVKMSV